MKIAILEANHWHVPLYHSALQADGIDVVAVSDAQEQQGPEHAAHFESRFYNDYRHLLANEEVDFAFVFGRHSEMAGVGSDLIARSIPFSVEKPGGINADEVTDLNRRAKERGLFVSVPFIFRFSDLRRTLEPLGGTSRNRWQHMSFRFIAGPPERYQQWRCGWMLERSKAGGGCAINLAVHFIDLVINLTGEDIACVSAQMTKSPGPGDVEVFSSMMLRTTKGMICNIETGYTYPGGTVEQREFSFSLASHSHYIRSSPDGVQMTPQNGAKQADISIQMETDDYYATYVQKMLDEYRRGDIPSVGLIDLQRVMEVIDCAYASAARSGEQISCLLGS